MPIQRAVLSLTLVVLAACGGEAPEQDAGPSDSTVGTLDTGATGDAGVSDLGLADSGTNDSGGTSPDTGGSDSGPFDAGATDVGTADTGPTDSGSNDTGADAGGPPDTGPVDVGGTVDNGPAVLNPNWIGGPCQSNADCPFTDGVCLTQAAGYPGGMCTQACTQFCPDQSGPLNSVTFCIDEDGQDTVGACVSRCDYTLSPTGCRQGYVCQPEKRINQTSVVRYSCVPRTGLPNRPVPPSDVGGPCLSDSECNFASCIEGLPGGYCTKESCDVTGCPTGSRCWRLGGTEEFHACLDDCTSTGQCRQGDGYTCDSQQTCWYSPPPRPNCNTNGANDCAAWANQTSQDFVVVTKGQRRLTLCDGATAINSWCIGLGWAPTGDKNIEGDGKTPEGVFYIPRVLPNSQYYKAFLLSYPDAADATRGLSQGLITQSEHDAIVSAQNAGTEPPQFTNLGGLIEIHGRGSSSDWTWGCIAVDDYVIDILWPTLGVGDSIVVLP